VQSKHFIAGFAHCVVGYAKGLWQRDERCRKEAGKNSAPASVLGNDAGAIEHTVQ
jgi:hypothetical protein